VLSATHFLTHVGMSWIVANLATVSPRDRLIIVLAGTLPDLDGIGIMWSEHAYVVAHRAVAHGLLFVGLMVAAAMRYSRSPWTTSALVVLSFHLHVLLDVVGTGGLPIRYLWPFTNRGLSCENHWVLASWPNAAITTATGLGVAVIEWRRRTRGQRDRGARQGERHERGGAPPYRS